MDIYGTRSMRARSARITCLLIPLFATFLQGCGHNMTPRVALRLVPTVPADFDSDIIRIGQLLEGNGLRRDTTNEGIISNIADQNWRVEQIYRWPEYPAFSVSVYRKVSQDGVSIWIGDSGVGGLVFPRVSCQKYLDILDDLKQAFATTRLNFPGWPPIPQGCATNKFGSGFRTSSRV